MKLACLVQPLAALLNGLAILAHGRGSLSETSFSIIGAGILGRLAFRVLSRRGYRVEHADIELQDIKTDTAKRPEPLSDVILVANTASEVLDAALHNSQRGATILLFGPPYGGANLSLSGFPTGDRTIIVSMEIGPEQIEEAMRTLGILDPQEFGANVFPLDQYADAWDAYAETGTLDAFVEVDPRPGVVEAVSESGDATPAGFDADGNGVASILFDPETLISHDAGARR